MERPKVVVHNVASLDGRITVAPGVLLLRGDERWSAVAGSDEDAYERVKALYHPEVLLEGSGSFVPPGAEPEPLPAAGGDPRGLYEDYLPEAVVGRPGRRWFAAVDSRGRVRWFYKQFPGEAWRDWHLLVLVSRRTPPEYLAYLRGEAIPYLVAGGGRVDLRLALEKMAGRLGVRTVVSTGGGRFNGALLRAGLVDEVDLELFPALIGGSDTPSLFGGEALKPGEMPTQLEPVAWDMQPGGRLRLRYRVLPPAAVVEPDARRRVTGMG
ncbi:dihydrofolate reductase family protein [Calidithermus chliarophilus]|uniref:dihydrofolate reductase family protein n=1 Tax=Calidithermus chliarophilus TaxID=52023 RepID=UPI0004066277|nr:dihydrofolate reductase family protein [Calidithermus chliarophilus]